MPGAEGRPSARPDGGGSDELRAFALGKATAVTAPPPPLSKSVLERLNS